MHYDDSDSECEVCGKEGAGYIALIEGARLHVCEGCSAMGKVLSKPRAYAPTQAPSFSLSSSKPEPELVDDYPQRIHKARERMGLSLSVVAEKLNEKESFLKKVESGHASPPERLAHKLEKELGIRLFEEGAGGGASVAFAKKKEGGNTLLDLLEMQKKKK